ncbi:hypothetical protein [Amycolatopsis sp. NPDC059657]|uniref:hypothetical protein n=1 Tax=Amycolatopsis sp. NPDC059657 TaxID=3346899 RepID=UPI00366B17B5
MNSSERVLGTSARGHLFAFRQLTDGVPHVHEADLKRRRRTNGEPGHEATPDESATDP